MRPTTPLPRRSLGPGRAQPTNRRRQSSSVTGIARRGEPSQSTVSPSARNADTTSRPTAPPAPRRRRRTADGAGLPRPHPRCTGSGRRRTPVRPRTLRRRSPRCRMHGSTRSSPSHDAARVERPERPGDPLGVRRPHPPGQRPRLRTAHRQDVAVHQIPLGGLRQGLPVRVPARHERPHVLFERDQDVIGQFGQFGHGRRRREPRALPDDAVVPAVRSACPPHHGLGGRPHRQRRRGAHRVHGRRPYGTVCADQTWPAFARASQQVSTMRRVTTYGSTFAFGRRSSM